MSQAGVDVREDRTASQLPLDLGQGAAGKPSVAHIPCSLQANELTWAAQSPRCRKTHTYTENVPPDLTAVESLPQPQVVGIFFPRSSTSKEKS